MSATDYVYLFIIHEMRFITIELRNGKTTTFCLLHNISSFILMEKVYEWINWYDHVPVVLKILK